LAQLLKWVQKLQLFFSVLASNEKKALIIENKLNENKIPVKTLLHHHRAPFKTQHA